MLSLTSIFSLLFRLSLLCQGQVEGLTDSVQLDFFESQSLEVKENRLQQALISLEGFGSLVPTIEVEERTEVESEHGSSDFILGIVPSMRQLTLLKVCQLFRNKAIRGSLLPLYDFFHSWKIHLS